MSENIIFDQGGSLYLIFLVNLYNFQVKLIMRLFLGLETQLNGLKRKLK